MWTTEGLFRPYADQWVMKDVDHSSDGKGNDGQQQAQLCRDLQPGVFRVLNVTLS